MADVSISAGNVKMKDSPRVPATIRIYALTDFNLADGTPIQASSPYSGGNAYKSVALTPSGSDPTVYAFSLFTIPATEDAAVNPNTARWGVFLFDGSTTPRLITHVSGLASIRVPVTPTPTTLSALALYNGGSLAPVVVNVSVTGTLTVAGLTTLGNVVIGGTLNGQGVIGGSGVADRISYWTDTDTLASSPFLRIGSDEVEQRGSNGANKLHISAGYTDGSNWAKASIDATTAVVIYGVTRLGSAVGIPVRLASYNNGLVQFGDHNNVWWEMTDGQLLPKVADFAFVGNPTFPVAAFYASIGIGKGFRFCSGTQDVAGLEYGGFPGVIKAAGGGGGRGTIQIGDTLAARPTAEVATRGLFWFTQGGVGVSDKLELCLKIGDVYVWERIL